MKSDDLKLWSSYGTAVLLAIGSGVAVVVFMFTKVITSDQGLPILTLIIGGATGFLWGAENATRAVKDFQKGLNTPAPEAPAPPPDPEA